MYLYVLEDFQRWAERGYHDPYVCNKHSWMKCLAGVSPEGLYIKCALCLYKKIIGQQEYAELLKAISLAKQAFKEE